MEGNPAPGRLGFRRRAAFKSDRFLGDGTLNLNNLRVSPSKPISKSISAKPRAYATAPKGPAHYSDAILPLPPKRIVTAQDRQRSQRVLLRVRAKIHVALQGNSSTLDTLTLSVNPQGATVVLKHSLPPETRLVLEHAGTHERVACKVIRSAREMAEGFHVPLEFDSPAPDFWRIAFPPLDWRPDEN